MKRSALYICAGILASLFIFVSAYSQEDMVVINDPAFYNLRRPPSVFRHEEHNEKAGIEACNECHHVFDDEGKLVEDDSSEDLLCSDCHGLQASGNQPGLMQAFHLNCKGCHEANGEGPVMCGQCHVRGLVAEE